MPAAFRGQADDALGQMFFRFGALQSIALARPRLTERPASMAFRNDEGPLQVLAAFRRLAGLVGPPWWRSRITRDRLPHHGAIQGKVRNCRFQSAVLLFEVLETLSPVSAQTVVLLAPSITCLITEDG